MRRDESVDAPADSIKWASNLFRTRATQPKQSIVKRLSAILQMDLAPNKAAFGERSATASQVRQMLFRADENAVDLRIERGKQGFSVHGQILGEGFGSVTVILSDDANTFQTITSDMSEFRFDNVPGGRYELLIQSEAVEISLKAIDIE